MAGKFSPLRALLVGALQESFTWLALALLIVTGADGDISITLLNRIQPKLDFVESLVENS